MESLEYRAVNNLRIPNEQTCETFASQNCRNRARAAETSKKGGPQLFEMQQVESDKRPSRRISPNEHCCSNCQSPEQIRLLLTNVVDLSKNMTHRPKGSVRFQASYSATTSDANVDPELHQDLTTEIFPSHPLVNNQARLRLLLAPGAFMRPNDATLRSYTFALCSGLQIIGGLPSLENAFTTQVGSNFQHLKSCKVHFCGN